MYKSLYKEYKSDLAYATYPLLFGKIDKDISLVMLILFAFY